jgi:hypothetical protein
MSPVSLYKRRRDLASSRTQAVCRMHVVRCGLVPGGVPEKIIAAHAAPCLARLRQRTRWAAGWELAVALPAACAALTGSCVRPGRKLGTAVRASGTTRTSQLG